MPAELGMFSLSLAVQDLDASLEFYEALGFEVADGGHQSEGYPDTDEYRWRLLANGDTRIGLFEGMFERNMLTFNPPDVPALLDQLEEAGVAPARSTDDDEEHGTYAVLHDPDGNPVLLDQP